MVVLKVFSRGKIHISAEEKFKQYAYGINKKKQSFLTVVRREIFKAGKLDFIKTTFIVKIDIRHKATRRLFQTSFPRLETGIQS